MPPEVTPQGIIRPARLEEAADISEIVRQAYTPWIAVVGRRPRPMDDDYEERCRKGHAWLLDIGGKPVGVVIVEEVDGALFLHNIAVAPQEQHRGFGRLLMHFIEEEALRRGFREVRLTTTVAMQRNVDLYRSLEYVITGSEPTTTVDRLLMSKRLDSA